MSCPQGNGIRSGVAEGASERVMRAWAGGWPSSLWRAVFAGEVVEWWACVHLFTPSIGGLLLNIYTQKSVYILSNMGTSGDKRWLLGPREMFLYLLSFLPTPPLLLATSSTASWHGVLEVGEKGRLFWKHVPACCQLCWWTQSLNLLEQSVLSHLHGLRSWSQLLSISICKCIHGLSFQVAQFLLLSVCIKCLKDYCNVSLQLVRLVFIILDIIRLYNAWVYAGCIFCQLPWLCRAM